MSKYALDYMKETNLPPLSDDVKDRFGQVVGYAFGGWHHVGDPKRCGTGVKFSTYGGLATFDFNQLTKLVLISHAVRVRAEIGQGGPRQLNVYLHPRIDKPDSWSDHHPSLADLVASAQKLMRSDGEQKT